MTPTEPEISTEILTWLSERGLTGDDLTSVAKAWLCTEAEINMWAAKTNTPTTNQDTAAREISKLATQIETAIRQHGRIKTPALAGATPQKLLQAIDYYEHELDQLWPTYRDSWNLTPEDRAPTLEKWTRLNSYLWEAKTVAGIPALTVSALTGETLTDRLQATLKGATA